MNVPRQWSQNKPLRNTTVNEDVVLSGTHKETRHSHKETLKPCGNEVIIGMKRDKLYHDSEQKSSMFSIVLLIASRVRLSSNTAE